LTPRAAASRAERALDARRRAFERYLKAALPDSPSTPRSLAQAMRYSALSPGKRIRPLLVLTACEAVGGEWRRALPAAAAVECVHAFSLVHDDLPALDDDDLRRGRPTTHKVYGEATALLAGDALLALAFGLAARTPGPKAAVEAVCRLAEASGSRALVGGQVLDLEAEGRLVTARTVRDIHLRKTGALLEAALMLGAIAGGAGLEVRRSLGRLGLDLGLAFQIQDDLLNRVSTAEQLGKRSGTDDARRKATYPRVLGEAGARAELDRLLTRVRRRIATLGPRAALLRHLVEALAIRSR